MSAIKTLDLKFYFSMFLLLIFFGCEKIQTENKTSDSKTEEITFIGLSNVGGELGNYRIIKIKKDSIFLETGTTANQKHQEWKKAITPETWKDLVSSLKIKDLSQIESSSSIQPIDGIDETFQVKTTKKSHIYVNAYNDTYYKQFETLKLKLDNILPKNHQ